MVWGLAVGPLPADQTEPGEAVVERVSAGHHALTVLDRVAAGHFGSTVVHLPHQVQPLPVRRGVKKVLPDGDLQ